MIKHISDLNELDVQYMNLDTFYATFTTLAHEWPEPELTSRADRTTLETLFSSDSFYKVLTSLLDIDVYADTLSAFHEGWDRLEAVPSLRRLRTVMSMSLGEALTDLAIVLTAGNKELGSWRKFGEQVAHSPFGAVKMSDFLLSSDSSGRIGDLLERLVEDNPHSRYPTSPYRESRGNVVSSADGERVEAVMTSRTFTTIKVTENVLDTDNPTLRDVYKNQNRCVALVDTNVETYFGVQLEAYFEACGIPLVKLVYRAMEVDKGIQTVERMLGDFKQLGVSRNEPILIAGGGVLCDTGGLACALYHRNTPYVMLSTSIVAGIDAGPSPRTCCDGFGYKNLFGSYHTPILSITDRSFFRTLKDGWVRHGIAEIIKMASVKDEELFQLLEQAGDRLIRTRFGTINCDDDPEIRELSTQIIRSAIRSYVEAEYGNLYETHQCRPHAFGHTWSPGFEIPAGLLHGHAVTIGMGFGAYLSHRQGWISDTEMRRIFDLIHSFGLSLWHEVLEDKDILWAAQEKMTEKRGGNLAAPLPKGRIGACGYLNDLSREELFEAVDQYRTLVAIYPDHGRGVEPLCTDVGLEDPGTVAHSDLVAAE